MIAPPPRFATLRAMIFPACLRLLPGLLLLALCATGCIPTRDGTQDEQREPNFQRGQELRNQLDHRSAAEAFERALDANPRSASAVRTHSVKSGDIPATIAKQYGVKLEALLAANPQLDPKRMKIGQTLTLPAP